MKRVLYPICLVGALALAPLALADTVEDCRQMAAEESVPVEDLEDYVAECVAMLENAYPDETGEAEELIPETGAPDGGGVPAEE
jgi:hypothetical protein